MDRLPEPIGAYLQERATEDRRPAWARVTRDGVVQSVGGELTCHVLERLSAGDSVARNIDALEGLFPLSHGLPFALHAVELHPEHYSDVHLLEAPDGLFLLFLDVTAEVELHSRLQQKGNDLNLLRERQGDAIGPLDAPASDREPSTGAHVATVTFLAACFHMEWGPGTAPAEVMAVSGRVLRRTHEVVARHAGLIQSSGASEILAVFGVAFSTELAARQALRVAEHVREVVSETLHAGGRPGGVAIGVATGDACVGEVTLRRNRLPLVVGAPVERARRLALSGRPSEILADEGTVLETEGREADFVELGGPRAGLVGRAFLYGDSR